MLCEAYDRWLQRAWLNNICIAQKTKRKALYSERFYLNSGSTNPTTIAVIQSATKKRALEKLPRLCFFGRIQEWILIWDYLDSLRETSPPFPPKTNNKKQTNKKNRKRFFSVPALFARTGKKKGDLLFSQNLSGRLCWISKPKGRTDRYWLVT